MKQMSNVKKLKMFLSLAWRARPSYVIMLFVNALVASGKVVANVLLPKFLVDELVGGRNIAMLFGYAGAIILSNLVFNFLDKAMAYKLGVDNIFVSNQMNKALSDKIMAVEYSYLENPYYLDLKERARFVVSNQNALVQLVESFAVVIKEAVTVISLLAILFTLSWVLVIILFVTITLSIFIQWRFQKYLVRFFENLIPINRCFGYYFNLGFDIKLQKDLRLYNMLSMYKSKALTYNEEVCKWLDGFAVEQGKSQSAQVAVTVLQSAIVYGYVGLRGVSNVFGKMISLGDFTMFTSAAISFTTSVMSFGTNVVGLFRILAMLSPFAEFMTLPDSKSNTGAQKLEDIKTVEFRNVSFSYPNSDKMVLDDISFEVNKGDKISIVGLNGAGKTTLIKVLSRLYPTTKGQILVNGIDINDYDYNLYISKFAAVFQDFKLFNYTIVENINGADKETNRDKVSQLLAQVGMEDKINSLDAGMDTMLGKNYDEKGIELSGGQEQKIAIARALYKQAPFIILDEPTSALDPLAEAEIYANFNQLVGDKTAFYISHRMSSSKFCDKILIIDGGKVVDFDTHDKLMKKKDSLYYKLFNAQAVNYKS